MQGDTAVTPAVIDATYPFSTLRGGANVLIFPNLEAANTACTLVSRIGGTEAIGPILMGLSKPVHVLRRNAEVSDIVNLAAIAAVDAQQTVAKWGTGRFVMLISKVCGPPTNDSSPLL
jgi:malate dehydrogenase (oxaloacetate-decarboxylating)(NADP+)